MADDIDTHPDITPEAPAYTRREALAALARYSTALGAATTIVTADGLVSAASAYSWPSWLNDFCRRRPNSRICTWDGWDDWNRGGRGGRGNNGRGNDRIRF